MSEPAGTGARRAALRLTDAVLRQGQPLETALDRAARGLIPADRGLAHAIAASTLRWLPDLDALIDSATRQRLPDDAKARSVLRLALVQALHLGTPPHAAIATALPLVSGGPRRLVHGVFGTLMRRHVRLPAHPHLPNIAETRWAETWGEAVVTAAATLFSAPPPIDLSLKPGEDAAGWAERLGGHSLAAGHVRLPAGTRVEALEGFAGGHWWVQDLAASIPARLLGRGDGRHVLDLCAAPGGKTLQLAAAGWTVDALDISANRLARLAENLARTGLTAGITAADLFDWAPPQPVDAVLLDAPCSATGIYRRHPDVLHRVRATDIAALADQQRRMAARAVDWLKPGGMLVYAVCSLERTEGEEQIDMLLDDGRLRLVPVGPDELPAGLMPDGRGTMRTLPGHLTAAGGVDGFFVARFQRTD